MDTKKLRAIPDIASGPGTITSSEPSSPATSTHSPLAQTTLLDPPPTQIRLGKHDDHNLNLKLSLDLGGSGKLENPEVNIYLFSPSAAHLRDFQKAEVASDFYSRAKIITRGSDAQNQAQAHLIQHMDSILAWLDTPPGERTEDISLKSSVRNYGAAAAQAIKLRARRIRQTILLYNSLSSPIDNPTRQIEEVVAEIHQLRRASYQIRGLLKPEDLIASSSLQMLETYLHHLTVEAISEICSDLEMVKPKEDDSQVYQEGWLSLWNAMSDLKRIESQRAKDWLKLENLSNSPELQEIHMLKISHLKTFFQSVTFVEITRKATLQRFSEPIAAFGAAFAALSVSIFEVVYHTGGNRASLFSSVGLQTIALISLSIAFYTIRDRLKDYAKNYTLAKLSKVIPDVDMELFMSGKKVGKVREWFQFRKASDLPEWVRQARMESCISEPEKAINEDVFEYKKLITVEKNALREDQVYDETLRINLERYLRFLDDRKKQLRSFDADGNLVQLRSHRVYHFHLAVLTPGPTPEGRHLNFYRVVVDKKGIDRVQHLSHASI